MREASRGALAGEKAGRAERSAGAGRRVDADRGTWAPDRAAPRAGGEGSAGGRIATIREAGAAFEVTCRLFGPTRPFGYEGGPHKSLYKGLTPTSLPTSRRHPLRDYKNRPDPAIPRTKAP